MLTRTRTLTLTRTLTPPHPHPNACQVLSDTTSRKKYDLKGRAGLEKQMVDPGVVFKMMFGDSMFEHLVAELAIVRVRVTLTLTTDPNH